MWTNKGTPEVDSDGFRASYGDAVYQVARALAQRAVDDWNAVITNFDYAEDSDTNPNNNLNNTFNLTISAYDLMNNNRGQVQHSSFSFSVDGSPKAATVELDDNAAGAGWFFDQTPLDDAEFTAIVNSGAAGTGTAFQASFVDYNNHNPTTGVSSFYNDFYRTAVHEIGHALGITSYSNAAIAARFKPVYDASNSLTGLSLYDGVNLDAMFVGGHIYQGPTGTPRQLHTVSPTVTFTEYGHPNELLNPGPTVPPDNGTAPNPTTRQFISDLDARILADAYGYTVTLPSTINTAHASLDSQTGTLLVQGGVNSQGFGQIDTIIIDVVGSNIRVQVNNTINGPVNTVELFPSNLVRQIIVAQNGGADIQTVTGITVPVANVQQVVSTNQDSANAGTLGDEFVDIDAVVPGRQVALRAAIRDINGMAAGTATVHAGRAWGVAA